MPHGALDDDRPALQHPDAVRQRNTTAQQIQRHRLADDPGDLTHRHDLVARGAVSAAYSTGSFVAVVNRTSRDEVMAVCQVPGVLGETMTLDLMGGGITLGFRVRVLESRPVIIEGAVRHRLRLGLDSGGGGRAAWQPRGIAEQPWRRRLCDRCARRAPGRRRSGGGARTGGAGPADGHQQRGLPARKHLPAREGRDRVSSGCCSRMPNTWTTSG